MKKVLLFTLLIALASEVLFASVAGAASDGMAMEREPSVPALATCPNPYVVRAGDTVASIARRCGLTVYTLKRLNGIGSVVRPGQRLYTRSTPTPKAAPAAKRSPKKVPTPAVEPRIRP